MAEKLTHEQFVYRAIGKLRNPERSKGIHTVFSGFNDAFRAYFPNDDPVATTQAMVKAGKIAIIPSKRGVMLYMAKDAPTASGSKAKATLEVILA